MRETPDEFSPPLPPAETGLLSVIIPAVNEEAVLPHLLNQLQQEKNIEVIVAAFRMGVSPIRLAALYARS